MRNLKIGVRLGLGFGIVLMLTVITGLFAESKLEELSGLTSKLYKHPFAVSTSMLKINGDIVRMHRSMKDVALAKNDGQMVAAFNRVNAYEASVFKEFDLVEERFLGDKSRVLEARQLFADWKPIREEVVAHMRAGERAQAAAITKEKGADHVAKLSAATQYLIDFAFNKADQFIKGAEQKRVDAIQITYIEIVIAVLAGILLAFFITRSVTRPLQQALVVTNAVAGGDLSSDIEVNGKDEIAELMSALKQMNSKLQDVVSGVQEGAAQIHSSSNEIASGNADLSQRTEEQASSLEETASSMEEMTSTVKQNADNARQANQLAASARDEAEKGGEVVGRAVAAMAEINSSSKKIADIISVIDEIAFQTNLLALNAAVEAARAGEQGRGFAVVAGEVRTLAGRSAEAAKEIKGLIEDSVGKVEQGSALVDESGKTLEEIVNGVKKVTDIVSEMAAATQEQSAGIEQVNKAVMQMDEMTQQNAALVEEAAASSEAMKDQARQLGDKIAFFRIRGGIDASAATAVSVKSPRREKRGANRPFTGHKSRVSQVSESPEPVQEKVVPVKKSGTDDEWSEF